MKTDNNNPLHYVSDVEAAQLVNYYYAVRDQELRQRILQMIEELAAEQDLATTPVEPSKRLSKPTKKHPKAKSGIFSACFGGNKGPKA